MLLSHLSFPFIYGLFLCSLFSSSGLFLIPVNTTDFNQYSFVKIILLACRFLQSCFTSSNFSGYSLKLALLYEYQLVNFHTHIPKQENLLYLRWVLHFIYLLVNIKTDVFTILTLHISKHVFSIFRVCFLMFFNSVFDSSPYIPVFLFLD